MDNFRRSQYRETPNNRFQKYGITVRDDGFVDGPKRPASFGKTPKFKFEDSKQSVLEPEVTFLLDNFGKRFSIAEHQAEVLRVVDRIFQEITGISYKEFSNIIVMSVEDFDEYKRVTASMRKQDRGISGDFQGINLGGLIMVQDTGGDNCFPLLFHELGHTLYPDEHDNYIDEFRAMYFQILCTKKFEKELGKIGLNVSYLDDFYEGLPLPTEEHRKAFYDARALFVFQTQNGMIEKGSPYTKEGMKEFQEIIKQD